MLSVHIEFNEEDRKILDDYKSAVKELSELVIEIFEKNQGLLLAPVFRELVSKKAHEVNDLHKTIHAQLMIDNPGKPLVVVSNI
jgi:hypothetical protein